MSASTNPVAAVVLAHLEARATREAPEDRRAATVRLVKGLYERGWSAADVRRSLANSREYRQRFGRVGFWRYR